MTNHRLKSRNGKVDKTSLILDDSGWCRFRWCCAPHQATSPHHANLHGTTPNTHQPESPHTDKILSNLSYLLMYLNRAMARLPATQGYLQSKVPSIPKIQSKRKKNSACTILIHRYKKLSFSLLIQAKVR